ncbi:hypothetical protein SETIT_9G557300v2 [Setaria italica]|uniref:Uncharacterized protein n=1 Tax=Setaria italica TaxID=4555 RepID=A0A368SWG1_SETIT|nr:hypothetical protein SETIT_9G557300v2 [Setaria italica]
MGGEMGSLFTGGLRVRHAVCHRQRDLYGVEFKAGMAYQRSGARHHVSF